MPKVARLRKEAKLHIIAAELMKGATNKEALAAAGYNKSARQIGHAGRSYTPQDHPAVIEIMQKMRDEAVLLAAEAGKDNEARKVEIIRSAAVTANDIYEKLDTAFHGACEDRNWPAAVNAAMSQAKVLGLLVDRRQTLHTVKPVKEWTKEECMAALGAEEIKEIASADGNG